LIKGKQVGDLLREMVGKGRTLREEGETREEHHQEEKEAFQRDS
jgi:hypothetical protein